MRTYLYVSDAKVDMYLAQIDSVDKERTAARLGINLGLLSASLKTEQTSLGNRMTRLAAVEDVIRREKRIGSIEAPSSWIEGVLNVAAATFPLHPEVMFFFSNRKAEFFGLAGSTHHMVGNVRSVTATTSISHQSTLLDTIASLVTTYSGVIEKEDAALAHYVHMGVARVADKFAWTGILRTIADGFDEAPKQTVSFLARRLVSEVGSDAKRYTLATPLYLALEDE